MFKVIVLLFSLYITISLCAGKEEDYIRGYYCTKGNGLCVSGLQRCGKACLDCAFLIGTKCGFCRGVGNCKKTCSDVGGILKEGMYGYDYKECTTFKGY